MSQLATELGCSREWIYIIANRLKLNVKSVNGIKKLSKPQIKKISANVGKR